MSTTIAQAFERASQQKRAAAFIPYVTGGYPNDDTCLNLIQALEHSGADVIEVGIPFSDPVADGPVIQHTSKLALDGGATPASVLALVERAAAKVKAPLVLMTYVNPIMRMGFKEFAQRAAGAGAAGVIVPDLTPEEGGPWLEAADAAGLDNIGMAAPTTSAQRLTRILEFTRGFLYFVSMTGVTGADLNLEAPVLEAIAQARAQASVPVGVGFGVSRPEHAAALAKVADGVIVGSALMKIMLAAGGAPEAVGEASRLAGSLAGALIRK